jgi:hypothetical protein
VIAWGWQAPSVGCIGEVFDWLVALLVVRGRRVGTIPAAAQHQQVDHEPDETVETGHAPILAVLEFR